MDIAELFQETMPVTFTYGDKWKFKLVVYTERMTPAYKAKFLLAATRPDAKPEDYKDEFAEMLSDLIESWTDENDKPIMRGKAKFEPTYENLMQFSYQLLKKMNETITTALGERANPPSEKD